MFRTIDEARFAAKKEADKLESRVPIYECYSDPTMYALWNGHNVVEWVDPVIEIDDGY